MVKIMLNVLNVLNVPKLIVKNRTYINGGKSDHQSSEGEGLFCSPLTPMIRYVRSVFFLPGENRTIKRLFGA